MRRMRSISAGLSVVLAAVLTSSCSGSGHDEDIATLGGKTESTSASSGEAQLLAYVACLRGQGLDIPDPEVDSDGNLLLNPGAALSANGSAPTAQRRQDFRNKYAAAQKSCGAPPPGVVGNSVGQDQTDLHDALLAFAKCMREHGIDVPDPDVSGNGNAPSLLAGLDLDDPAVKAARDTCGNAFAGARAGR